MSRKVAYSLETWLQFFAIAAFMFGAAILGVLGVAFQDFAFQWQPAPENLPFREALAIANGVGLILAAVLMASSRRRAGVALLSILAFIWALFFHLPVVASKPTDIPAWLGLAEISAIAMGAGMLVAVLSSRSDDAAVSIARYGFGLCLLIFGLSHLAYPDFTAGMVPSWIPFPLFWAYATGIGHIAAGLSVLSGVLVRLASILFTLMVFSFVLLLHVPRVAMTPASRIEWTMLGVALLIGGAAAAAATLMQVRRHRNFSGEAETARSGATPDATLTAKKI